MSRYATYEDFTKDGSKSFIDKIRTITNENADLFANTQIDYISQEIYNKAIQGTDKECKVKNSVNNPKVIEHFEKLGFSIGYDEQDKAYHISWYENGRPYKR